MPKTPAASAKKDLVDRLVKELSWTAPPWPITQPLDPAGADTRLARGWEVRQARFVAGLAGATDEGRALWAGAKAFVDAGMPDGLRQLDEQAVFFLVAGLGVGEGQPTWPDFVRRWVAAGGLGHAIEVALRITQLRLVDDIHQTSTFRREADLGYGLRLLTSLAPDVAALDPQARAALRARVVELARDVPPPTLASLAITFDDELLAKDAIARAEAAGLSFRDPWPAGLFSVLRDAETFAHLLARGAEAFQFYGAGIVFRARDRISDAGLADALVRFFAAAMAEPRRVQDATVSKFAGVACLFGEPEIAWLFDEHGKHKWLKKYAPLFAARHPSLRPKRPSERALAARMVPIAPPPRPAGFTHEELAALDPVAREDRILTQLQWGHLGTAFALRLLVDHPTPRVAVAIYEKITHPNFATQMPKPGFHKELQADLSALAKKHPDLAAALAMAKKANKKS